MKLNYYKIIKEVSDNESAIRSNSLFITSEVSCREPECHFQCSSEEVKIKCYEECSYHAVDWTPLP
jgi:hypothetical protein